MPGFIGLPELLILGVVALLVFGPKRLPELGRSLGSGMREFKDSVTGSNTGRDPIEVTPIEEAPEAMPDVHPITGAHSTVEHATETEAVR